jgi:hypothetical protein
VSLVLGGLGAQVRRFGGQGAGGRLAALRFGLALFLSSGLVGGVLGVSDVVAKDLGALGRLGKVTQGLVLALTFPFGVVLALFERHQLVDIFFDLGSQFAGQDLILERVVFVVLEIEDQLRQCGGIHGLGDYFRCGFGHGYAARRPKGCHRSSVARNIIVYLDLGSIYNYIIFVKPPLPLIC